MLDRTACLESTQERTGLEQEEVEIWVYGAEISEQLPVKNIEFVAGPNHS